MEEVTDPEILKQLEGQSGGEEVTDPMLLNQLEPQRLDRDNDPSDDPSHITNPLVPDNVSKIDLLHLNRDQVVKRSLSDLHDRFIADPSGTAMSLIKAAGNAIYKDVTEFTPKEQQEVDITKGAAVPVYAVEHLARLLIGDPKRSIPALAAKFKEDPDFLANSGWFDKLEAATYALDLTWFGTMVGKAARAALRIGKPVASAEAKTITKEMADRIAAETDPIKRAELEFELVHNPNPQADRAAREAAIMANPEQQEFDFKKYYQEPLPFNATVKEVDRPKLVQEPPSELFPGFKSKEPTASEQVELAFPGARFLEEPKPTAETIKVKQYDVDTSHPEAQQPLYPGYNPNPVDTSKAGVKGSTPAMQASKEALDTLDLAGTEGIEQASKVGVPFSQMSTVDKLKSVGRKAITATVTAIRESKNPVGEEMAKRFMNYVDIPETVAAETMAPVMNTKLTQAENRNLMEILNEAYYGKVVKPMNDKVARMSKYIQSKSIAATQKLGDMRGLGATPSMEPRGHFPHQVIDPKKFQENMPKFLVETQQAKNLDDARNIIDQYARYWANRKFKGAESARVFHVHGYDNYKKLGLATDVRYAFNNYFYQSAKRAEELTQFGKNGVEGIDQLFKQLATTDPDRAYIASRLFTRLTGRDMIDHAGQWMQGKMINWSALTMMGMSGLMQLGSLPNTVRFGAINAARGLYKGLKSVVKGADRDFVQNTGAIFHNMAQEFEQMYGTSRLTTKYLSLVGVNKMDELTRAVSTHAAKPYLDNLLKKLAANPENKMFRAQVKELFLDADKVAKEGLKGQDYQVALKRLTDSTIGRVRPTEVSLWFGSPYARMITLFKNYLYFQTKFQKDLVKFALVHKTPKYLLPTIMAQYPVGYLLGEARAAWTGRERPKGLAKVVDNIAMIQGLGIFLDLGLAATSGKERLSSYILGAPLTLTATAASKVASAMDKYFGEGKPLNLYNYNQEMKFLASQTIKPIPFIGPRIYTSMFPDVKRTKSQYRR